MSDRSARYDALRAMREAQFKKVAPVTAPRPAKPPREAPKPPKNGKAKSDV